MRKLIFMILLLPVFSNLLVIPLGQWIPPLGDIFVPCIANLSHAVLFGVITITFWGKEESARN